MTIAWIVIAIQKSDDQWQAYGVSVAVLGACWLSWTLFRRYQRQNQQRRSIRSPEDMGFNSALSYSRADAERFYGRQKEGQRSLTESAPRAYSCLRRR